MHSGARLHICKAPNRARQFALCKLHVLTKDEQADFSARRLQSEPHDCTPHLSFTTQFESDAVLTALQVAVEARLHMILRGAALAVRHRGGSWAEPKDLQLSRRLLGLRH